MVRNVSMPDNVLCHVRFTACIACLLLTGLCWAAAVDNRAAEEGPFLFSYFKGNGETGLHLAYSLDGLAWKALNGGQSLLKPELGDNLMRDPSIVRGPDGVFHMVWTTGWGDQGIGIAHSEDLIAWSEQTFLPVMAHEPDAQNCWAPEIFYDETQKEYLIFWSTTIPGRFPDTDEEHQGKIYNHRMYMIKTNDFETYTDPRLFYDDGFNVIDGAIIKSEDAYVMLLKDETFNPVAKNIRLAKADKASGPYSSASEPFSPSWVEGPTALRIGDFWYVYYDAYTRGRMEGARSKEFQDWEDITDRLSFPDGIRHGTAFPVPQTVLNRLLALQPEKAD